MARHEVMQAVKDRFAARFGPVDLDGVSTAIKVFHPNEEADTNGAAIFVQVQYPVANAIPFLNRRMREEGAFRLLIHTERGWGSVASSLIAGALTEIFSFKRFGGVQTFAPSSPVNDDRNDNGAYFTTSVTVPYHFYYDRGVDLYT